VASVLSDNAFHDRTMQFSADLDAKFQALTLDQVNAAIRRAFKPDTLSVFSAGDFAKAAGKDAGKAAATK
jgi:zinc protease